MAARGTMVVLPAKPLRIPAATLSSSFINLAKHERVTITCPPAIKIVDNKIDEPPFYSVSQTHSDPISVVNYKPAPNRLQQIHQHNSVQQNDDGRLNNHWREKVTFAGRYKNLRPELLKMLEEFEAIWH